MYPSSAALATQMSLRALWTWRNDGMDLLDDGRFEFGGDGTHKGRREMIHVAVPDDAADNRHAYGARADRLRHIDETCVWNGANRGVLGGNQISIDRNVTWFTAALGEVRRHS